MQRYEISRLKRGIRSSTEQANKSIRFALIQKTSMTFSRINSPFLFLLPFTSSSLQFLLWLVVIVCKAKQLLKKCVRTSAFLVSTLLPTVLLAHTTTPASNLGTPFQQLICHSFVVFGFSHQIMKYMSCRSMNCYKTVGKDLDRIPITEMMKTGGIMFKSNCANCIWN